MRFDLNDVERQVLNYIEERDVAALADIAERFHLTDTELNVIVDKLIFGAFIERGGFDYDRPGQACVQVLD